MNSLEFDAKEAAKFYAEHIWHTHQKMWWRDQRGALSQPSMCANEFSLVPSAKRDTIGVAQLLCMWS